MRPFAVEFLKELYKYWNLAVFTAAVKKYAIEVVNSLDPNKELIFNILHRDHCSVDYEGNYIKDLRIIKNFDQTKILHLDNKLISFAFNVENGMPILPFYGDKYDSELKYLIPILKRLSKKADFRKYLNKRFNYEDLESTSI